MILKFRQWMEDSFISTINDPELNGLERSAHYKPPKKSKLSKVDALFGKTESGGAGFVFTDGKTILLLLRANHTNHPNTWDLPAGHSKQGETPLQTAKREAKEEIGKIQGKTFHKSDEGLWTFFFNKVDKPFICKLNEEHTKSKWISLNKLNLYELHPKLKNKINKYVNIIKEENILKEDASDLPIFNCQDCHQNLIGISEYPYMLKNNIWEKTRSGEHLLCIGCLEKRLKRKLNRNDFNWDLPINNNDSPRSEKLKERMAS